MKTYLSYAATFILIIFILPAFAGNPDRIGQASCLVAHPLSSLRV